MIFTVTVDVPPGRFRVNKAYRRGKTWGGGASVHQGDTYADAKSILGEKAHLTWIAECGAQQFQGPVAVRIVFRMDKPHRKGPAKHLGYGDIDGPIKGVLDALEAAQVFANDAQVVELSVQKVVVAKGHGSVSVTVTNAEVGGVH